MKTVLTSIITSIITVIVILFAVHAIWGGGECVFNDDDHDRECKKVVKKECVKAECCAHHEMMMEKMEAARAEFEATLSDEEKATIAGIREKFEGVDHEKMCPEGKAKFEEQYKEDLAALMAIADNHKDFFDGMHTKMHPETTDVKAVVEKGCPEAAKCKDATEKCMDKTKEVKTEAECKKAEEECMKECLATFKIHFLLMENDDDDGGEEDDD